MSIDWKRISLNPIPDFRKTDKQIHFGLNFIGMGFGLLFHVSSHVLVPTMVIVAIGKEVYDYFHPDKHSCELADAIAGCLGGLAYFGLSLL